jgi:tetratricopeptide (TPR) repeat protein
MRRYLRPAACGTSIAWKWTLAFGLAFAVTAPAFGQIEVLNELYGSGVHAYNAGSFREAYDDLSLAIRNGSRDPRVFYYRGLTYLRLGRPQEAQRDFKQGASLEMADSDRFYPVSKSLERIQGQPRVQIERYRSSARLVAYQTRERRRYERYERIRKNEPNVLMAPDEATEIPSPAQPPTTEPDEEPKPDMPAEKPESDTPDPFGEEKTEPAEDMPAEDMPAEDMPAEDMPADEMPAEKPEAEADPFGEEGDKTEPAEEMPAEKADGDADPFGEDDGAEKKPADEMSDEGDGEMPADDAAEKDDGEMPAEDASDEKPADEKKATDEKKPADDDPFSK